MYLYSYLYLSELIPIWWNPLTLSGQYQTSPLKRNPKGTFYLKKESYNSNFNFIDVTLVQMIVIWDNGDWLMRGWSCVPHLCNILIGHSDIIDGWYLKVKVKGILKTETLCPKCKSPCVKEVRRKNFRFFKCFKCNIEESIRKRSFLYNKVYS